MYELTSKNGYSSPNDWGFLQAAVRALLSLRYFFFLLLLFFFFQRNCVVEATFSYKLRRYLPAALVNKVN